MAAQLGVLAFAWRKLLENMEGRRNPREPLHASHTGEVYKLRRGDIGKSSGGSWVHYCDDSLPQSAYLLAKSVMLNSSDFLFIMLSLPRLLAGSFVNGSFH